MTSTGPIFITGFHRSGKTLVRWLLDSHPQLAISQRTQMWPKFYRRFGPLSAEANLAECMKEMRGRMQVERLGVDWEQVRDEFEAGPPTYAHLFEALHKQFAHEQGAERWGDQSTNLDRYTERIIESYRGVRIIHMVRDPLDSFAAFENKETRRLSGPGVFAAGWARSARFAARNQTARPGRYLVVRYEDLVTKPEATAREILDFVGVAYLDDLLRLGDAKRYEAERLASDRGWAITPRYLGTGNSLEYCPALVIMRLTKGEREIWRYERPDGPTIVGARCLTELTWQTAVGAVESLRLAAKGEPPSESASFSVVMQRWHNFTNSKRFRHAVKRGWASAIFKSASYQTLDVQRRRWLVRLANRDKPRFDQVRTFTLFVGHNKSGTSLLGSLLDAHRRMVVSDEANAIKYFEAGLAREEIFRILFRASVSEARKGRVTARRLGGYAYVVAGQWQGRAENPIVVGDSMSGTTTRLLSQRPDLIDLIEREIGHVDLKLLQVIRNPFDPITLMAIRGRRSVENSIDHYFAACDRLLELRRRLGPGRILPVYYEDLVANTREELARVCSYLGTDADAQYTEACAALVDSSFEDSRNRIEWDEKWISEVHYRINDYAFLRGYSFDTRERQNSSS